MTFCYDARNPGGVFFFPLSDADLLLSSSSSSPLCAAKQTTASNASCRRSLCRTPTRCRSACSSKTCRARPPRSRPRSPTRRTQSSATSAPRRATSGMQVPSPAGPRGIKKTVKTSVRLGDSTLPLQAADISHCCNVTPMCSISFPHCVLNSAACVWRVFDDICADFYRSRSCFALLSGPPFPSVSLVQCPKVLAYQCAHDIFLFFPPCRS